MAKSGQATGRFALVSGSSRVVGGRVGQVRSVWTDQLESSMVCLGQAVSCRVERVQSGRRSVELVELLPLHCATLYKRDFHLRMVRGYAEGISPLHSTDHYFPLTFPMLVCSPRYHKWSRCRFLQVLLYLLFVLEFLRLELDIPFILKMVQNVDTSTQLPVGPIVLAGVSL